MDHDVSDCPRMIAKMEEMNMNKGNRKADAEMEEPQKELEKVLI